jgi:hypothetical protein
VWIPTYVCVCVLCAAFGKERKKVGQGEVVGLRGRKKAASAAAHRSYNATVETKAVYCDEASQGSEA